MILLYVQATSRMMSQDSDLVPEQRQKNIRKYAKRLIRYYLLLSYKGPREIIEREEQLVKEAKEVVGELSGLEYVLFRKSLIVELFNIERNIFFPGCEECVNFHDCYLYCIGRKGLTPYFEDSIIRNQIILPKEDKFYEDCDECKESQLCKIKGYFGQFGALSICPSGVKIPPLEEK